jgi:hypothetical protein
MSNQKTAEDMKRDAVGVVYGILKLAKYATYFIVFCIVCFVYKMLA